MAKRVGQGTLYVVATPIGNLNDISPRALEVLRQVDLIACEDTRHTGSMLAHFGITTGTTSYHEHNEMERSRGLLDRLEQGADIALVSDAGTPLLSDPGFRLVAACRRAGMQVEPIPGPFAAAAALSVSGLPTDRFLFVGFLPKKKAAFRKAVQAISSFDATLVFYLSPHQLCSALDGLALGLGNRKAFLIREMTKIYETSYSGSLLQILERARSEQPRGEYTLVVQGSGKEGESRPALDVPAYVEGLMALRGIPRSQAIRRVAAELGLARNQVYSACLEAGNGKTNAGSRKDDRAAEPESTK